ncbi:hypothetical protein JXI42_10505 [bacterium]|nr:hypothetical protein [bacterium]
MKDKPEIQYKKIEETLVATTRFNPKSRQEIIAKLQDLKKDIPDEYIAGPPFCIIQFVTSVAEGYDAEVGFPVTRKVETASLNTKMLPRMGVLSLVYKGPLNELGGSYGMLYKTAYEHGLISDEFCREVYLELNSEGDAEIEIQFVIHEWERLFAENLERVLGDDKKRQVMEGIDALTIDSLVAYRFNWLKGAMVKLENSGTEDDKYEILSKCSHVFPKTQIEKLRVVYEKAKAETNDGLQAVDAVIKYMKEDPGWGQYPRREGMVVYSYKKPRDPEGFKNAKNRTERCKAYCFCPLIREHLEEGMPVAFCYCGAGWYRQQWEGAIGKPVRVEIVKSILKGDEICEFAIKLPGDL